MEHLTHGWEPDLDDGDSLLRRYVMATADRAALIATAAGGRVERTESVALADPDSAVFFDNAAVLLQPPGYVDLRSALEHVLAFYPPERHFVLMSAWPTEDLSPSGLELMGHPPLMFRPAGGAAPPLPAGLSIREVDDGASLAEFIATLVDAYPMPGGERTPIADPSILGGPLRFFTGYVDGVAVATSGARIGPGIVDVEWVSTREAHRRRGFGAAVTWAATLAEPSLPAVLIASDDGQPVYEAMGYVRLLRLTLWHRPPG